MKTFNHTVDTAFQDDETVMRITRHPSMAGVFLKALFIAPFRSNSLQTVKGADRPRIVLNNYSLNSDLIRQYNKVCGFNTKKVDTIPMPYLQTLFIGLLGKFITSPRFPFSPMGLIQIFQSFEMKRRPGIDEPLHLSCSLDRINRTDKGFETDFLLQAISSQEVVWQGISRYLSRVSIKKDKRTPSKNQDGFLEKRETIFIPSGSGRQYAKVSGDYNPHHLYPLLAKIFGFKTAIAHGMYTLARVLACLDKAFGIRNGARVEAGFKLPVFMPAATSLGYETGTDEADRPVIRFELRDDKKGLPHLSGQLRN